jgi:L-asparaginase II
LSERPAFVPLAVVERGGWPESWHLGAAAVTTPDGRSVARLGDPSARTFFRSSAKPFQAVPLVVAHAAATTAGNVPFDLDAHDLALICASHSGGPEHVARAASLLERGGFTEDDLRCGAHRPLGRDEAEALRAAGEEPTPLHNNCSGKHAGMLLTCRLLELEPAGYLEPDHPLQRRITAEVSRFTGLAPDDLGRAVDGCSAPTFHLPLEAAARSWAALAAPRLAGLPGEAAAAAERLVEAMGTAPGMLAGRGRFTTRLAEVTGGRVIGKEGAEGVYTVAVRGPVALGVAIKIADGSERARDGVVLELLRQAGSLAGAELDELSSYYGTVLRNHRAREVGRIVPDFELEEIDS